MFNDVGYRRLFLCVHCRNTSTLLHRWPFTLLKFDRTEGMISNKAGNKKILW